MAAKLAEEIGCSILVITPGHVPSVWPPRQRQLSLGWHWTGQDRAGSPRDRFQLPADAHEFAHKTIHEQTRQAGTGRDRETAKLLLRHTTADVRLRDEKTLKRLRA